MRDWQVTIPLETGTYYRVLCASITNDMSGSSYIGRTPMFQAVGDKMTIYCGIQNHSGVMPDMPDEWCVIGKDTQNFGIWATESKTDTPSGEDTPSEEETPDGSTTPIPGHETDVVPDTDQSGSTQKPNNPDDKTQSEEKSTSAKIGDYIMIGIVVAVIIGCTVAVLVIDRRKKQIK